MVGQPAAPGGVAAVLPWGVAFVALLALVAMFAGRNFGAAKGSGVDGSANSLATQAIDGPAAASAAPFAGGAAAGGRAPDLSNMTPSEIASRLFNRVMELAEAGKVDSAVFIGERMALPAHEMLPEITIDERYHYGRLAEVVNNAGVARAQADTILQREPNHLLGLLLRVRAARMDKDPATERQYNARFLAALDKERNADREEYRVHKAEIDRAEAEARK
ncbi:MAG: hypothetical protein C0516_11055 [Gemmatimonas sp.]|nr:hypothetical protein [Gemmatimonas sp.]